MSKKNKAKSEKVEEINSPETQELILCQYSALSDALAQVTEKTRLLKESFLVETETAKRRRLAREDANFKGNPDVDYIDLEHFIGNCRTKKDKESFDTAIRILEAIKKQVLSK